MALPAVLGGRYPLHGTECLGKDQSVSVAAGQRNAFYGIGCGIQQFPDEEDKGNQYVKKAVSFIQSNYCNPIKVTDVADYVCINRSYLYT